MPTPEPSPSKDTRELSKLRKGLKLIAESEQGDISDTQALFFIRGIAQKTLHAADLIAAQEPHR
jgi:hypothetical protein